MTTTLASAAERERSVAAMHAALGPYWQRHPRPVVRGIANPDNRELAGAILDEMGSEWRVAEVASG